jgi:UDP-3-O-[3-hydroxymyristoyl] glucosamine N-acyltransferase
VTKDVAAGQHVAGVPAVPIDEWREGVVLLRRLPELRAAVAAHEARLAALESRQK